MGDFMNDIGATEPAPAGGTPSTTESGVLGSTQDSSSSPASVPPPSTNLISEMPSGDMSDTGTPPPATTAGGMPVGAMSEPSGGTTGEMPPGGMT